MTELDRMIKRSLRSFVDAINREEWSGRREREATWTKGGESNYVPLAILEWKMGRVSPNEYDVRWLEECSRWASCE